jgi:ABC-2 type transport system permease protein
MIQVFSKEVGGFLNSLIAYIVIGVFLTAIGLLMWVFQDTSVLENGFADLETLFTLAPYVLIFLIPAITMKSFAEERKLGTMELLQTKPLTDWDILLGKFFAAVVLVLCALLPTLVYYYTVYQLGNPVGNVDSSGTMGSYIGLFLLGAVFCAIGILASSVTNNQIIAFLLAAFLCFLVYTGFDSFSALVLSGQAGLVIKQLGILYHYESLSRGLIDSRDVIYFMSVCSVFLLATKTVLGSRSW